MPVYDNKGNSPEQTIAIEYTDGPQIILAGPGSGKTRVIVEKAAYLVEQKGYSPAELLVLTYSDNTAEELNQRMQARQIKYPLPEAMTFHAFGQKIIQRYFREFGLPEPPEVADDYRRYRLMRQAYFEAASIPPGLTNPDSVIADLDRFISRAQDELVDPGDVIGFVREKRLEVESIADDDLRTDMIRRLNDWQFAGKFYEIYQALKKKDNLIDYGDMLAGSYGLLKSFPDILAILRNRYRYILFDEFQDANSGQVEMVALLGEKTGKVCVVGDDDQSIYRFRGASYGSFVNFKKKFPKTVIHRLSINFRSTPHIVGLSQALISYKTQQRFDPEKKIVSNKEQGDKVGVMISANQLAEAQAVKDLILSLLAEKEAHHPSEIAVISRAHEHRQAIRRALANAGIPFSDKRPLSVFTVPEAHLVVSLIRAVLKDDRPDLIFPILARYCPDLSPTDYAEIGMILQKYPPFEALKIISESSFLAEADRSSIKMVYSIIEQTSQTAGLSPESLAAAIIENSGIMKGAVMAGPNGETAVMALTSLWTAIAEFEERGGDLRGLSNYLDWAEANNSIQVESAQSNGVHLITAHAAKGLEFPLVIVIGLSETRFPQRPRSVRFEFPQELSKEIEPPEDAHFQEERRLLYVAATRASRRLYLSGIKQPRLGLSRFLNEIVENAGSHIYGLRMDKRQPEIADSANETSAELKRPSPTDNLAETIALLEKADTRLLEDGLVLLLEKLWHARTVEGLADDPDEFRQMVMQSISRCHFEPPPPIRKWETERRPRLSYTDLKTYERCPLQYKFKKIYKMPEKILPYLHLGSAIHQTIFEAMSVTKDSRAIRLEDLEESFLLKWRKYRSSDIAWMESLKNAGLLMLRNFIDMEKSRKTVPLDLEKRFVLELENCQLTGQIDRIDTDEGGELHLIDYKTGKIGAVEGSFDQDDDQLTIYAIACAELYGGKSPKSASLYFLAENREVSHAVSTKRIDRVRGKVLETADKIAAGEFPPKPNSFECGRCSYKNICPHKA